VSENRKAEIRSAIVGVDPFAKPHVSILCPPGYAEKVKAREEEPKPEETRTLREWEKLAEHYRKHGDSPSVLEVESALTDAWQAAEDVAEQAGRSLSFVRKALPYLVAEGRAETMFESVTIYRKPA
jgi:hypothetical protein